MALGCREGEDARPMDADPQDETQSLHAVVTAWRERGAGSLLVLTGAGISAESGIPTFRGADGFWTHGSKNHRSTDVATQAMFRRDPTLVWEFYLMRMVRYGQCEPNVAHHALVDLEASLQDRFCLATQNVDGLHVRAGNSLQRTYRIHGDLGFVRCGAHCGLGVVPVPAGLIDAAGDQPEGAITKASRVLDLLRCPRCGDWLRPHVLWFDEFYDERNFRWDSTMAAAEGAALVVVVGTSGATNLPNHVVATARQRGVPLLVIGLDESPFTAAAEQAPVGAFLRGPATQWVPALLEAVRSEGGS